MMLMHCWLPFSPHSSKSLNVTRPPLQSKLIKLGIRIGLKQDVQGWLGQQIGSDDSQTNLF